MKIDCRKTENYLKYKREMCYRYKVNGCIACPLSIGNNGTEELCTDFQYKFSKKAVDELQKWVDENIHENTTEEADANV